MLVVCRSQSVRSLYFLGSSIICRSVATQNTTQTSNEVPIINTAAPKTLTRTQRMEQYKASFINNLVSFKRFCISCIPIYNLRPNELLVSQAGSSKKILKTGLNLSNPLATTLFRGFMNENKLSIYVKPCLTKDSINIFVSAEIIFSVSDVDKLDGLGRNLNDWVQYQSNIKTIKSIREIALRELFQDSKITEDLVRQQMNEIMEPYGLACDSVFFSSMVPPPGITYEFEKIVCATLSREMEKQDTTESFENQRQLLEKKNVFALEQSSAILATYTSLLSSLAPHFKTSAGQKAAETLSNPGFFAAADKISKQIENTPDEAV